MGSNIPCRVGEGLGDDPREGAEIDGAVFGDQLFAAIVVIVWFFLAHEFGTVEPAGVAGAVDSLVEKDRVI